MSYLLLSGQTLDLRKATISVWFRVPKESADAIEFFGSTPDFEVFDGVIPILVFGKQKRGTVTDWTWTTIGYALGPDDPPFFLGGPPTVPVEEALPSGSHQGALAPTFIGVDKDGNIAVHIQTGAIGIPSNLGETMTSYLLVFTETDPGFYTVRLETEFDDFTNRRLTYPDSLGNDGLPTAEGRPHWQGFQVTFDAWHHLLLSWDLGDGNASHGYGPHEDPAPGTYITKTSTLYCAIDDVNKDGDDLPGLRLDGEMQGPNEIISYGTYQVAGSHTYDLSGTATAEPPAYSVAFDTVSADGMAIPSALEYDLTFPPYSGAGPDNSSGPPNVSPIRRVEMAELQVFTGITLDTSIETNRRAFIDYERDDKGKIIKDKDGKTTLKPVSMDKAEELLRKKPEIKLHGSSKWKNGKNTGTTGVDYNKDPPVEKPDGQFQPVAKIEAYKPDPSLVKAP